MIYLLPAVQDDGLQLTLILHLKSTRYKHTTVVFVANDTLTLIQELLTLSNVH